MEKSKLSDLLDQLAEKYPDDPLASQAVDEYASLYQDEENLDDDLAEVDADSQDIEEDAAATDKSFDDLLAEDSAETSETEDSDDLSDIFGAVKPKDGKKSKKKPPSFDDV